MYVCLCVTTHNILVCYVTDESATKCLTGSLCILSTTPQGDQTLTLSLFVPLSLSNSCYMRSTHDILHSKCCQELLTISNFLWMKAQDVLLSYQYVHLFRLSIKKWNLLGFLGFSISLTMQLSLIFNISLEIRVNFIRTALVYLDIVTVHNIHVHVK